MPAEAPPELGPTINELLISALRPAADGHRAFVDAGTSRAVLLLRMREFVLDNLPGQRA